MPGPGFNSPAICWVYTISLNAYLSTVPDFPLLEQIPLSLLPHNLSLHFGLIPVCVYKKNEPFIYQKVRLGGNNWKNWTERRHDWG